MEGCEEKKTCSKKRNNCLGIIVGIIFALFLGTIGIILGTVFSAVLLLNIGTLIAVTVLLGVALALLLIYKLCMCKSKKTTNC